MGPFTIAALSSMKPWSDQLESKQLTMQSTGERTIGTEFPAGYRAPRSGLEANCSVLSPFSLCVKGLDCKKRKQQRFEFLSISVSLFVKGTSWLVSSDNDNACYVYAG
jgi:hypothetical protein